MSTRSSRLYLDSPLKDKHGQTLHLHIYRDYRSESDARHDATWVEVGFESYNKRLRLWPLPPIVER